MKRPMATRITTTTAAMIPTLFPDELDEPLTILDFPSAKWAIRCRLPAERKSESKPLDDRHVRQTAAFAHCLQARRCAPTFERVQQRRHPLRPGASHRVSQRDPPA